MSVYIAPYRFEWFGYNESSVVIIQKYFAFSPKRRCIICEDLLPHKRITRYY